MFTKAVLNPAQFENAGDETKYWKNLAHQLFTENEGLNQRINALTREIIKRPESSTIAPTPKRIKKHSLDPLDFNIICEDVQGLIMQHLNGKDLLAMSEVSKKWNKLVEAGINEKVTLSFGKAQNIEITRKFENVSVELNNAAKLKSVSMIADNSKNLKIVVNENKETINFNHLKRLQLEANSEIKDFDWISRLQVDQLEELKITGTCFKRGYYGHDYKTCPFCYGSKDDVPMSQYYFNRFFAKLKNLKHLDLSDCSSNFFLNFFRDDHKLKCQLETLKCVDSVYIPIENKEWKSLKTLTMHYCGFTVRKAFEKFKELTTLELEISGTPMPERELFVNKSIKNLSIKTNTYKYWGYDSTDAQLDVFAMFLLKALPELETLFIPKLTSGLIRFLAGTNLKLKTVKYNEIAERTLEEYEEMRQTQPNINRDIQIIH